MCKISLYFDLKMCYHKFIFLKCVTKIHILRLICNHGKYYYIGNSTCVISYQHSTLGKHALGKHARSSDNDFRFAVNSLSTFDTESFSQLLMPRVSVNFWYRKILKLSTVIRHEIWLKHLKTNFDTNLRQLFRLQKLADECSTAHIFESNYYQKLLSNNNQL